MLLIKRNNNIEIASIVVRSLTLTERLSLTSTNKIVDNTIEVEERLNRWCQVVAKGDFAKFTKRLAWAGLDLNTIRAVLTDNNHYKLPSLPSWAVTLERVIGQAKTLSREQRFASQGYLDREEPIPFEHVYLPCLQVAQGKLLAKVGSYLNLLTESVRSALERQLLKQLNDVCFATLMAEFSAFRPSENTTLDFILSNAIDSTENGTNDRHEKYDAFIEQLYEDGLMSLFQEYPVLGRLVARTIDLWVDATGEFCDRLAANWSEIERRFSPEQPLKQVVKIKTGLSDPHNGCRMVTILTFDTDMTLVYKPKDVGIDVAFFQLLDWFNCQEAILPFKVLQVLNYGTHGWIEYVEQLPCGDLAAAKRFYQRAGILLCLVYLLDGTDCHSGNVIANGEHLALIDLETLLHHRVKDFCQLGTDARELAATQLSQSVLQTMILPRWGLFAKDSLHVDLSALGGTEEQKLVVSQVQKINMDAMYIGTEALYSAKKLTHLYLKANPLVLRIICQI